MTLTSEQAKQFSADAAKALALEPNEEIRAYGSRIVNLFAELARESTTDEERASACGVVAATPNEWVMFGGIIVALCIMLALVRWMTVCERRAALISGKDPT